MVFQNTIHFTRTKTLTLICRILKRKKVFSVLANMLYNF